MTKDPSLSLCRPGLSTTELGIRVYPQTLRQYNSFDSFREPFFYDIGRSRKLSHPTRHQSTSQKSFREPTSSERKGVTVGFRFLRQGFLGRRIPRKDFRKKSLHGTDLIPHQYITSLASYVSLDWPSHCLQWWIILRGREKCWEKKDFQKDDLISPIYDRHFTQCVSIISLGKPGNPQYKEYISSNHQNSTRTLPPLSSLENPNFQGNEARVLFLPSTLLPLRLRELQILPEQVPHRRRNRQVHIGTDTQAPAFTPGTP